MWAQSRGDHKLDLGQAERRKLALKGVPHVRMVVQSQVRRETLLEGH